MNTCKECNWWDNEGENEFVTSAHYGSCSCKKFVRGYNVKREQLPSDGVWLEDDEGWSFYTGPDFGCIHWKAEEAEA
jgi:hypothetical protein